MSFLFQHAMKKLARAMEIRFGGVPGNARQRRYFTHARAQPMLQAQADW